MFLGCSLGVYYIPGTRLGTGIKSHFILSQGKYRLGSCQMQGNRYEPKNPLISVIYQKNTYFKAFSNLVSVSNRANKLSPVGKVKYLEKIQTGEVLLNSKPQNNRKPVQELPWK